MTSSSSLGFILDVLRQLLDTIDEEAPLCIALPDQNAEALRVRKQVLVLGLGRKLLQEESWRRLHAVALYLPEPDLVYDGGR